MSAVRTLCREHSGYGEEIVRITGRKELIRTDGLGTAGKVFFTESRPD